MPNEDPDDIFSKRGGDDHFLRFAKRGDDHFLRFAKPDDHFLRFAKADDHFLRFAKVNLFSSFRLPDSLRSITSQKLHLALLNLQLYASFELAPPIYIILCFALFATCFAQVISCLLYSLNSSLYLIT